MMRIRVVRMPVDHRHVPMPMAVGFAYWIVRSVRMPVMSTMSVPVLMVDGLVLMFVFVRFREVQIKADCHQEACAEEAGGDRLVEHRHGQNRPR
jgi:hypothetical protein